MSLTSLAEPLASRSEALYLLLQAAFAIDAPSAAIVAERLDRTCRPENWRSKRALRNARQMLAGEIPPRAFFW